MTLLTPTPPPLRALLPLLLLALLPALAAAPGARADLPARTVLVMDLRPAGAGAEEAAVARTIQATLITELGRVGGLDVVSRDDIKDMVTLEAARQASGCDDDLTKRGLGGAADDSASSSCLAEIAGALGASLAISGDVGRIGALTVVNLSLFDTKAAAAAARTRTEVDTSTLEKLGDALLDALPTLLAPALTPEQLAKYRRDIEARRDAARTAPLQERKGPALYVVEPRVVKMAPAVATTVSSLLADTASHEGMAVFTRDDARIILEREADLQVIGAESDGASLSALGRKLGTGHVLACVVSSVDDDVIVAARLIDVAKAAVVSRRSVKASDFKGSLVDTVAAATRLVLQPVFAGDKGTLAVASTEEGANVYVDDGLIGTTPLPGPLSLPGGHHLLAVEKQGFVRYAEAVRIDKGARLERHIELVPSAEFVREWRATHGLLRTLGWTGAGVAAAGAVAAAGLYYAGALTVTAVDNDFAGADLDGDPRNGLQLTDEKTLEYDRARRIAGEPWQYGTGAALATVAVAGGIALGMFIFGEDPARYDAFVTGDTGDAE